MPFKNLLLAFLVLLPLKSFSAGYTRIALMYMSENSGQGSTAQTSRTLIDLVPEKFGAMASHLVGCTVQKRMN